MPEYWWYTPTDQSHTDPNEIEPIFIRQSSDIDSDAVFALHKCEKGEIELKIDNNSMRMTTEDLGVSTGPLQVPSDI